MVNLTEVVLVSSDNGKTGGKCEHTNESVKNVYFKGYVMYMSGGCNGMITSQASNSGSVSAHRLRGTNSPHLTQRVRNRALERSRGRPRVRIFRLDAKLDEVRSREICDAHEETLFKHGIVLVEGEGGATHN
jgi:hypothetical protein